MQVTTNGRVPGTLLAVALFLMAAGSLRDLITPAGYWLAWAGWAVAALAVSYRPSGERRPTAGPPPAWVSGSYALLCLGMVLSAAANRDWVSAYQAFKIAVIAGMFLAMWRLVGWIDWRRLVQAAAWVVALMLLSLAVAEVWNPTGQALAAGPRHGSFLAVYGVMWKVGVFFVPLFLADMLIRPTARLLVVNGLLVAACVFLVLADGSRTGLLLLGAIAVGFLVGVGRKGDWRAMWKRLRWGLWVPVIVVALLLVGTGTRIGQGDPARAQLLREGVPHAIECQPLGCGFGSTGADVLGTGALMATHNAYVAALGDFGLLGLAGMLGFLLAAWWPIQRVLWRGRGTPQDDMVLAAAGSALAYGLSLMLNTFTTEMSEWGYLILMLALAWAPPEAA